MEYIIKTYNIINKIINFQFAIATFFLLFMTTIIIEGVFMRYVLNSPQAYSVEFARFSLMPLVAFAMAYTQKSRSHVRVDMFLRTFNKKIYKSCIILSHIIFLIYAIFISYSALTLTVEYYIENRISEDVGFILWPIPLFMMLGSMGLSIQLIVDIIYSINAKNYDIT